MLFGWTEKEVSPHQNSRKAESNTTAQYYDELISADEFISVELLIVSIDTLNNVSVQIPKDNGYNTIII